MTSSSSYFNWPGKWLWPSLVVALFGAQARAESPAVSTRAGQAPQAEASLLDPVGLPVRFRKFSYWDGAATAVFGIAAIVSPIVGPKEGGPSGGVWVDDEIRNVLRADTFSGRLRAADASDVALGLSVSYGLFFDPFVNASWMRRSPDVGLELGLINLEVFAVTLGIQQLIGNRVGRERPYGQSCREDPLYENTHTCEGRDRYRSFFSGHTAVSFSMAAATCVHHGHLGLSTDRPWIACVSGFFAAAFTGTMRIVSDYHYASDVMTGALVGTGVGVLVPLLHYSLPLSVPSSKQGQIWLTPLPKGISLGGTF